MKTVALLPSPLAAGGPILAEWLLNTDCRLPGSAFRLSAFRATNEIAPAGTGANCNWITAAWSCNRRESLATPFYCTPKGLSRGCVS